MAKISSLWKLLAIPMYSILNEVYQMKICQILMKANLLCEYDLAGGLYSASKFK
jgi:hypothetical protein